MFHVLNVHSLSLWFDWYATAGTDSTDGAYHIQSHEYSFRSSNLAAIKANSKQMVSHMNHATLLLSLSQLSLIPTHVEGPWKSVLKLSSGR